jgi:hypothetical protein
LRAAGFGAGFALVGAIILGLCVWWLDRPVKPKPWNSHAITPGGKNQLEIQVRGEVFYLEPTCDWKNNTASDYSVPDSGTVMRVDVDNGGLEKLDDATWGKNIVIPAGQTVNVKLDLPYTLSDYGETASSLSDFSKLSAFADKRMKGIRDLKFFDYSERYEIDCPDSWNNK